VALGGSVLCLKVLDIQELVGCKWHDAQNPLDMFPRNFPVDGEVANLLRTCWRANKSATSLLCRCNGIWETIRHNRLLPVPTCYGLVADLLRGSRHQLVMDLLLV